MIRLMKSSFYRSAETKKALAEFIAGTDMYSMGVKCREFEEKFAAYYGCKYALFVNSGSSANLALMQALRNAGNLEPGDEVGVSALTWSTNIMPVLQMGCSPVPLDIAPANLNVSSEAVAAHPGLRALFTTNVLGFCNDPDSTAAVCQDNNILFCEDNCESFGSEYKGRKLGTFSKAATFSFFVGHHMSTIEGGMVITDDQGLYDDLIMVRAHGWSRQLSSGRQQQLQSEHGIDDFYNRYTFYQPGYNLRPTELNAVIGLMQLPYADEINRIRQDNFKGFMSCCGENPDIEPLDLSHMDLVSNFAFPVIFKSKELSEAYKKQFHAKDVEIRPIISGDMTMQPFFKSYLKDEGKSYDCPHARKVHNNGFYLPNNPELTREELDVLGSLLAGEHA